MKTVLLLLCVAVVPSCKSPATVRDYFDLWFVVPKNPFHPTTTNDDDAWKHEGFNDAQQQSAHPSLD